MSNNSPPLTGLEVSADKRGAAGLPLKASAAWERRALKIAWRCYAQRTCSFGRKDGCDSRSCTGVQGPSLQSSRS